MAELSQEKLEEMVVGKPPKPRVVFFEKPVLDHAKSRAAGRRVYKNQVMIKKTHPGVRDWVASIAKESDILKYRDEYEYFQRNRSGVKSPSVDIIPGIPATHTQELIDYGLGTIDKLAGAHVVPEHLQYLQDAARRIQKVLKEDGNADSSRTEGNGEGGGSGGVLVDEQGGVDRGSELADALLDAESFDQGIDARDGGERREMPAVDRREQRGDVGRREVPSGGLNADFSLEVVMR